VPIGLGGLEIFLVFQIKDRSKLIGSLIGADVDEGFGMLRHWPRVIPRENIHGLYDLDASIFLHIYTFLEMKLFHLKKKDEMI
jgi:GTPase